MMRILRCTALNWRTAMGPPGPASALRVREVAMSHIQITVTSCRTCNGSGFIWRGRVMQHETLSIQQGKPTVHVYISHIRDICPECHGTGATLPREIQRTPWALALRR